MKQEKLNYSNLTTLPNNFLAEQAILNILLTNSFLVSKVSTKLKPETFYFEPHRILYEIFCTLDQEQIRVNPTNVITRLQDQALLKKIGGIECVVSVVDRFENFSDLDHYITQVNEKYLRRLIIQFGKQSIADGYTTSEKIEAILNRLEQSFLGLNQENLSQKVYTAAEILDDVYLEMKSKIENKSNSGYRSSFPDLDSVVQGFQKSDLIIIAGRPSMGKTAFALNLAKNIMIKYKIPLIIFTLEMSRQQIMYRFLSSASQLNANRLKSGKMTLQEWKNLSGSMKDLADLPLFIDDNPNLTVSDIRLTLRKIIAQKKKEGLVVIDYLQLMKIGSHLENRVQEISQITRNLKILAKEFEIPILLLSQLSRNVESRINKRPMLSDLRESGSIEQDADIVIMLYRDDYYSETKQIDSLTEFLIVKHRNGPTGVARLMFNSLTTSFSNVPM
jgi:replicative DNA helicase